MLLSTPGNAASSGTQTFTVRVTGSNCNAEWGQALLEQPASHSQFPYQGIASFASKIESKKARSSRRAARRALQELRYPQLLKHDGKRFAAYVNAINGTPTGIIDTDSLDFTLGSSMNLTTKSEFETKANAFVDAQKDVFGLDRRQLGEIRILANGRIWFVRYTQL